MKCRRYIYLYPEKTQLPCARSKMAEPLMYRSNGLTQSMRNLCAMSMLETPLTRRSTKGHLRSRSNIPLIAQLPIKAYQLPITPFSHCIMATTFFGDGIEGLPAAWRPNGHSEDRGPQFY